MPLNPYAALAIGVLVRMGYRRVMGSPGGIQRLDRRFPDGTRHTLILHDSVNATVSDIYEYLLAEGVDMDEFDRIIEQEGFEGSE